ncbi:MAG: PAS domain S-box protein [Methanosarcina sp.]|uniref:PAS domain S-box protein n=1 Tax=Methanosarcina sp. TaxID=2213 RepID=UPI002626F817|nr:PAS domain S-box protein [Methanosarcina sp.]MDD3246550.1 PAS domain S-box protein [Methanosarcina sp.]MDD4248125.1 PAS domain S-box protein [Methanosarcina sp.]
MKGQLRKSGIDIIGDVPWGTHFCQFYQTKEDLMDILVPYFKAGLDNNEFCMWVTSQPLDVEEAEEALRMAVPDIDAYLKKGQIEIIPYTYWYVKEGKFDSERILNGWVEKLTRALANGYDGLRLSGNTFWLEKEGWDGFVEYEKEIDNIIGNFHMMALCAYPLDRCNATGIIDVVINHQFALIKREGKWEQIESSRRKKAEEEAYQAAKNWEYTFDVVPDMIAILDTEYGVVRVNRAMAARLGMTPEECAGLTCYRVVHGMDEPPSFCPHRQLLKDGLEHTAEVFEECLGGYFQESVSPLHDSEGKLTGCIHVARDLTESKRAEEALREGEDRLRFALETSHTGAWDLDLVEHTAHRSLEHDRIFGYEQLLPQWTYEMFLDHVLPEDRKMVDAKFQKATTTHSDWSFECRIRRVDGVVRWIWAAGQHRMDATGNVRRMAGIVQDITERKNVEEALRESEEKYRNLMETANEGIWILDAEARTTYVNEKMVEMLGCSREAVIGKSVRDFADKEGKAIFEMNMKKRRQGINESHEFKLLRKDGLPLWTLVNSKALFDKDGKFTGSISMLTDITKRKETEVKLKEAYENLEKLVEERTRQLEKAYNSLKESEKGLAEAQKMAHIGNWDWNLVTGEVYWSDELYRIFGREPQESGATYDELLNYVHPEDRDCLSNAIKKGLNGKLHGIDYRIVRASGEERAVHAQSEVIFDEENIPIRVKGIVQDITERKKAEEMLKENEGKLKALFNLLPVGVSITDKERNILDSNLALERILGLSRSDLLNGNYGARKYIRSNGTEISAEEFPSVRALKDKGSIQSSEIGILKEDGSIIWTDVSATYLPFSDGQVVVTTRDITESKKTAEELQKAEEKYRIVTERTGQLVYDYNIEGDAANWTGSIKECTGYTPDEFRNMSLKVWLSRIHPKDLNRYLENYDRYIISGEAYRTEYRFRKKNEEYVYFEDNGICLRDKEGNVNRILGVVKDITERKEAEGNLKTIEIARKKEIHHRIKNNLQVISSLLDLQAEKFRGRECVEDSEIMEAFRESQDRVISMALIHEELYKGGGFDTLNFSSYIEKLAENLFQTYRLGNADISLSMDLEENVFFDMDTAVPLGILINELISNSFKHAFVERDRGEIRIKLYRDKTGEYKKNRTERKKEDFKTTSFVLAVSDDGVGVPESFDLEKPPRLGIQLVVTLVDQLEGELELKRDSGTEFVVRFKAEEKQ